MLRTTAMTIMKTARQLQKQGTTVKDLSLVEMALKERLIRKENNLKTRAKKQKREFELTMMSLWISFMRVLPRPFVSVPSILVSVNHRHNLPASNGRRRRQPGQDASHFKVDTNSGRLQIDEDSDTPDDAPSGPREDVEGAAYREQMTSIDGFTRTPNGQIKFHKNTKKRRAEEEAADALYGGGADVEMADGEVSKKKVKKEKIPLGHEFKAKVRSSIRSSEEYSKICLSCS